MKLYTKKDYIALFIIVLCFLSVIFIVITMPIRYGLKDKQNNIEICNKINGEFVLVNNNKYCEYNNNEVITLIPFSLLTSKESDN